MATYGGGLIFQNTKSFVNVNFSSNSVVYTVPAGNNYSEFKSLSIHCIASLAGSFAGTGLFIENENGIGGWERDPTALVVWDNTFNVAGTTDFTNVEVKLMPGQRIVAVVTGIATGTLRFNYSVNQFSPAS